MSGIEQFHPVELYERFQEWRATNKARREFKSWQLKHPIEAQILDLLDLESKHMTDSENPRRARLVELAQKARKELGFGDHLVPYARELPFRIEEFLVRDSVVFSEDEIKLLREVNHGLWARVGFFTTGVRRLQRLG